MPEYRNDVITGKLSVRHTGMGSEITDESGLVISTGLMISQAEELLRRWNGWIPVERELPEPVGTADTGQLELSDFVLVQIYNKALERYELPKVAYYSGQNDYRAWIQSGGYYAANHVDLIVTHWRPLPAAPIDNQKENG